MNARAKADKKAELLKLIEGVEFDILPEMKERFELYEYKFAGSGVQGVTLEYACVFAKIVQVRMQAGEKLAKVVDQAARDAALLFDFDFSGLKYLAALHVLVIYWKHGEELRLWHNVSNGHPLEMQGIGTPRVVAASPMAHALLDD